MSSNALLPNAPINSLHLNVQVATFSHRGTRNNTLSEQEQKWSQRLGGVQGCTVGTNLTSRVEDKQIMFELGDRRNGNLLNRATGVGILLQLEGVSLYPRAGLDHGTVAESLLDVFEGIRHLCDPITSTIS